MPRNQNQQLTLSKCYLSFKYRHYMCFTPYKKRTGVRVVRTEAHIPHAVEEPTVLVLTQRLVAVTCRLTLLLARNH